MSTKRSLTRSLLEYIGSIFLSMIVVSLFLYLGFRIHSFIYVYVFVLFFYANYRLVQKIRLRRHGQKAEALILSIDDEWPWHYRSMTLNLRIEPPGQPAFEAKRRVGRYAHDPFRVGDRIPVLFDPQKPTRFTLKYLVGEDKL